MATSNVTYTYKTNTDTNGEPSTFEITLAAGSPLGNAGTVFDAFCADASLPILGGRQAGIYSGQYTDLKSAGISLSGAINWLLNAYPQALPDFPSNAVQAAIWTLMGQDWTASAGFDGYSPANAGQVYQLVGQALMHQSFVPVAGQSMAILIDPLVNGEHSQPFLVEVKAASLGDRVWDDTNANGVQDAGEAGRAGVRVELYDTSNTLVASTVTDGKGGYLFNGLMPGDYSVKFIAPEGTSFSTANVGADGSDSDANASGITGYYTLHSGEQNTSVDAGLVTPDVCAKLEGVTSLNEGCSGSYRVTLDRALDHDVTFTIQTSNGTAQRVDQNGSGQIIMWGGSWDRGGKVYDGGPGSLIPTSTYGTGRVRASGPDGNDSWDYTLYNNGVIQKGGTTTVTIKAGETRSADFSVEAWKESVYVDNDRNKVGYAEGSESFSVAITATSTDDVDVCKPAVTTTIHDTTSYHHFSPIALDLDGNGIQTTAFGQTQGNFDLLGNGTQVVSGWLSAGDAFLAIDANGNGGIDSVNELFGGNKGDGFAKLAGFDSNGDGAVNAADARFGELLVWQDSNSNHQSDAGEMHTLTEMGIASLNVNYADQSFTDEAGNIQGESSVATRADGSNVAMVDVYFNYAETSALRDMVSDDASLDSVLGASEASTPAATDAAAEVAASAEAAEIMRNLISSMMAEQAMAG